MTSCDLYRNNNANCYPYDLVDLYDRVVILDTESDQIIWISSKFSESFGAVKINDNILSVCEAITQRSDKSATILSAINELINNNSSGLTVKCLQYEIEIINYKQKIVILRLNNYDYNLVANSRHLEDREKLLFTSRSITVSEMASTLAHEINQPIGTINNLLYGLKARLKRSGGMNREILSAIDKSIEQTKFTSKIIARIRDYTQSRQPKLSVVSIKSLIEKCISLMDWEMRNTNVDINKSINLSDAIVFGDELMLQQVIVNLIRNGIDANNNSHNTNIIAIDATMVDNYIQISIQDNGKGMSDEEAGSIFVPFASNKSTGMGIGLNICRSFIELHKGKLWLTKNETSGCTSHIMLPLMT